MTHYTILNFHPTKENIPVHVGLIPDGTGRWAVKQKVKLVDAYTNAWNKLEEFLEFFFTRGATCASIYFSSIQNFKRSPEQINSFCTAQNTFVSTLLNAFLERFPARVIPVGNLSYIPDYFRESLLHIKEKTEMNQGLDINILVAYNPLEEIEYAIRSNDDGNFLENLWVKKPLDLVIRTSANLLSNFLPLQSGYARLYWIYKLFPDVEIRDYENIYDKFVKIDRKYGD